MEEPSFGDTFQKKVAVNELTFFWKVSQKEG